MTLINPVRNSSIFLNEVYFWTDTIKDWKHLLKHDKYKLEIINQLKWLITKNKIKVYGYVIMPNHLHLLWEALEMNGKEKPHASFNKQVFTYFVENTTERNHRFWQRDPLAVLMDSKEKFEQKLNYIHLNPLQKKWDLAQYPEEHRWSSAKFYLTGEDGFGILTHYMERF